MSTFSKLIGDLSDYLPSKEDTRKALLHTQTVLKQAINRLTNNNEEIRKTAEKHRGLAFKLPEDARSKRFFVALPLDLALACKRKGFDGSNMPDKERQFWKEFGEEKFKALQNYGESGAATMVPLNDFMNEFYIAWLRKNADFIDRDLAPLFEDDTGQLEAYEAMLQHEHIAEGTAEILRIAQQEQEEDEEPETQDIILEQVRHADALCAIAAKRYHRIFWDYVEEHILAKK